MRIDLHAHSNASDGSDPPADVIIAAAQAGLDVVALTDHDTFAGIAAAAAALPSGLVLVPGVEISCFAQEGERQISLHLLAYLCDMADAELGAQLTTLQMGRDTRARRMVEAMVADGVPITWDQVDQIAGPGAVVGRPHIGQALVQLGLIETVGAAFRPEWIGSRGRYHVRKDEVPVLDAIALVRAAGGVPVFAHPAAAHRGPVVSDQTYASMAAAGLWGLEADHPDHDAEQSAHVRSVALNLGLSVTGSSDYHGSRKGVRLGAHLTAPQVYEQLVAQARGEVFAA